MGLTEAKSKARSRRGVSTKLLKIVALALALILQSSALPSLEGEELYYALQGA